MKRTLSLLALASITVSQFLWSQAPGDLDPSFNGTGWVVEDGNANSFITSTAMMPDGRIVAAGIYDVNNQYAPWVCRWWPNGSLDTGFDGDGYAVLSGYMVESDLVDVAVQPDGKVVIATYVTDANGDYGLIARFDAAGNLDASFGQGGMVLDPSSSVASGFDQVHIQANGRILVTGRGGAVLSVTAFGPAGLRDNAYGSVNGQSILPIPGMDELTLEGSALMASGELTLVAQGVTAGVRSIHMVRVDDDGDPVAGFGTAGMVTVSDTFYYDPSAFAVGAAGEVYVAGIPPTWTGSLPVAVRRYTATGAPDNGWGQSGTALVTSSGHLHAWTMMVASTGMVYLAGDHDGGPTHVMAARLTSSGQQDASFGTNGIATEATAGGMVWASDIVEQADGKIIAAGMVNNVSSVQGIALRFLTSPALSVQDGGASSFSMEFYPNPACSGTTLRLTMAQEALVDVVVCDLSGRTVQVAASAERIAAGSHVMDLAIADLPAGLYQVMVRHDGQQHSGRLVVTH